MDVIFISYFKILRSITIIINRRKRSIPEPKVEPHTIHGGERAFLYQVFHWHYENYANESYPFSQCFQYVEDYLFTFGMDGKGCLLRAICEMHESPLLGYGLVGELLEVFLT